MKFIYGMALSFLLLASFALADADDASYLSVRADRISCSIDFHNAVMTSIVGKVPQASSLNDWINKLKSDETQLKTLAANGDHKVFEQYVRDTLHLDIKKADEAVRGIRKNYKGYNVTKEVRESLKESFKTAQETFKACISQNELKVADKRADYYERVLAKRQEQVEKLAKRNISTSALTDLINQAKSIIVTPLENAAKSGDTAQAQAALKQYCLWSGCTNGINFHFAAKFEIARLSALLAKITPIANAAGLTPELNAVRTELDAAKSALDAVGNADYGTGQRDNIWNHIKAASIAFRTLIKDLRNAVRV